MMSAPPVPPPQMPTLSAMNSRSSDSGIGGAEPAPKGQALLKLFHQLDMTIDAIASAAPGQSEALDSIKTHLKDVMTAIVNGGSGATETAMPIKGGGSVGEQTPLPR
jgi:hypothetical protein